MKYRIPLMVFIITLFYSCSSFIYYPNGANAPLLSEKDELLVSVGLKGFGGDIRSAFAITDHLGVQFNANFLNITNKEFETEYRNGNYYLEGATGFYRALTPKLIFEAYLGTGLGQSFSKNLDSGSLRTTNYHKIYLQQDIGLRTKHINFGIAVREAYVNAYKTKRDNIDQQEQYMDIFIEPILFLAIGTEKFKINAQAGISDGQFSWINSYAPFIFSMGIESQFTLK